MEPNADAEDIKIDRDLADLIPGYLSNTRNAAEQIRKNVQVGDFEDARRIGHNLKGSGGGYGFMKISTLGAEIEAAAREKNSERVAGAVEAMLHFLDNVKITYV